MPYDDRTAASLEAMVDHWRASLLTLDRFISDPEGTRKQRKLLREAREKVSGAANLLALTASAYAILDSTEDLGDE
jgi:hypothetical protein